jgi:hypothetical protein
MERLIQQATLSQQDLISCNHCWLALEAVTLADICTGDGKRIWADCVGTNPSLTHRSSWEFPVEKPSSSDKDRWQKGLILLTSPTFELPITDLLGSWILNPHRSWEWFYSPAEGSLYQNVFHDAWHCYLPSSQHSTRHRTFRRSTLVAQQPEQLLRATAWVDHLGRAHFEGAAADTVPIPPPPASIHHLIQSWADNWPLEHSFFPPLPE